MERIKISEEEYQSILAMPPELRCMNTGDLVTNKILGILIAYGRRYDMRGGWNDILTMGDAEKEIKQLIIDCGGSTNGEPKAFIPSIEVINVFEFNKWSQKKYEMSNNEWHSKIWRPFMCDYFMDSGAYVSFSKTNEPENLFEEHMNDFLDENQQFNGSVKMIFTD